MQTKTNFIPKKEFWMFGIAGLGQGMIYAIMSSYISDFYISVARLSPMFVFFLMLFARIWDSVNDPIMGVVVDKTQAKWGMKRFIIIAPIPIAVTTFLLFFAPDISPIGKMVYASITYVLWDFVYTISDVPFWCLPNVMTPNPQERGKLISVGRTLNGIGSAVPLAIFMVLGFILPALGLTGLKLEKTKYTTIALFAAVVGNALFILVYFFAKERVKLPPPIPKEKGSPSVLKTIFTCKPLMLVVLMGILAMGRYLLQAGAIHVARYSFYIGENLAAMTPMEAEKAIQASVSLVNTVFAVSTAAGMFGTMVFMPLLFKKFTYKQIVIAACLLGFVSGTAMFFIGYQNFWFCVPFLVLSSVPLGVLNIVSYAMVCDSLDYMEWSRGRRENGLGSACQAFVNKLSNALATSMIVLMYVIVQLDLSSISGDFSPDPTQLSHAVRQGMFSLVSIIPAVSMLLCIIPVLFYGLNTDKMKTITADLAERRKERGETIE